MWNRITVPNMHHNSQSEFPCPPWYWQYSIPMIIPLTNNFSQEVKKAADRMAADHVEYRQQLSDGGVEMEEMAAHTTFGQEEEESLERGGAAPLQLVLSSGSREREEKDPEQGPDSHSTQNT